MAKQRVVLSAEELALRRKKLEAGIPVATETESLQLREKIAELNDKLTKQETKIASRGPTTQSLRKDLDKLFEHYDIEPAEELIKLATEKKEDGSFVLSVQDRAHIWENMMQYRMPKLRAVEMSGKVEHNITIEVVKYSTDPQVREVVDRKVIDISDKKL